MTCENYIRIRIDEGFEEDCIENVDDIGPDTQSNINNYIKTLIMNGLEKYNSVRMYRQFNGMEAVARLESTNSSEYHGGDNE